MDIRVILVEVIHAPDEAEGIQEELESFMGGIGYDLHMNIGYDAIYVKNDFEMTRNKREL